MVLVTSRVLKPKKVSNKEPQKPANTNNSSNLGEGKEPELQGHSEKKAKLSLSRLWLFRCLALTVAPLVLLLFLEVVLHLLGMGDLVNFFRYQQYNNQEMVLDNQKFGRRFFPPPLVRHPQPSIF